MRSVFLMLWNHSELGTSVVLWSPCVSEIGLGSSFFFFFFFAWYLEPSPAEMLIRVHFQVERLEIISKLQLGKQTQKCHSIHSCQGPCWQQTFPLSLSHIQWDHKTKHTINKHQMGRWAPVRPAAGRLRQEDHQFKAILDCIVRHHLNKWIRVKCSLSTGPLGIDGIVFLIK